MSGHSKWHNIQKTKGAADAKRSAAFTKIAKEILVAVKEGGGSGDPANNSRLATVIAKAKAANMPNENIKFLNFKGTQIKILKYIINNDFNGLTNYHTYFYRNNFLRKLRRKIISIRWTSKEKRIVLFGKELQILTRRSK